MLFLAVLEQSGAPTGKQSHHNTPHWGKRDPAVGTDVQQEEEEVGGNLSPLGCDKVSSAQQ